MPSSTNPYETPGVLQEYLLLHYADAATVLPYDFGPGEALNFPARCVSELVSPEPGVRALELGCAVGRACFELSKFCDSVVGIDFSRAFILEAQRLSRDQQAMFSYCLEGELYEQAEIHLQGGFRPEVVQFEVGDATALRSDLGQFDIVLAANLLCRVPDPQAVLSRLPDLVAPAGQLVLTSPYTWLEEYTPKERWLGGFLRQGEPVRSLSTLRATLEPDFVLERTQDMPFLIREHARKFQWSVAQASVWTRKRAS